MPLGRLTAPVRMLPDFIIVGAQRAGTTSLYKYIAQHPDVGRVRLGKGVHYFDTNAERSVAWYRSHFPVDAKKVPLWPGPGHVGEGAPYYMFHPECPERIKATLPDVKVIAILRDPVERAHSQWAHETARGFEDLPFDLALRAEDDRLDGQDAILADPAGRSFSHQHHSYVARGLYAGQVQRLWDTFGVDRVLIIPSLRLFENPAAAYSQTLAFLGLSEYRATYEVHNARSYPDISADEEEFLAGKFAESNERLVEMLGPEFDFRRA
jgi:hypothetical protein